MKVDLPRARHAHLHEARLRSPGRAQGHRPRSRHHPGRGPAHLRDDPQGRHARHLPDREPRADVDAAAAEAADLSTTSSSRSRSSGRARSRATWCIPICAGAKGKEPVIIRRPNWRRCSARRSACRCSRSRRCGSRSNAPASRPARPTSCARAMATFKFTGGVIGIQGQARSTAWSANGYERDFAEQTFRQLEGFGSYGFPESHAASLRADRLCLVPG